MNDNNLAAVAPTALSTLLRKEQVCSSLSISSRTLEGLVATGDFPPGVQMGRHKYWTMPVVQGWLSRRFAVQQAWQPQRRR